jgi:tRNA(fMet)-specific endonuclease VapC
LYRLLRRAKTSPQIAFAYSRLAQSVESLSKLQILRFPEIAIARFEHLKSLKTKVRAPDLRIAAIALENGAVLVTRNLRDFRLIPNLQIEDWSKP